MGLIIGLGVVVALLGATILWDTHSKQMWEIERGDWTSFWAERLMDEENRDG